MDINKMLNVTLYILHKLGATSKTKLMKLLFFADFEHIRKYNRPITWAEYRRLPKGPVPSYFLDIINFVIGKKIPYVLDKDVKKFSNVIKVKRGLFGLGAFLCPLRKPKMEELSQSDKEILDEILKRYGAKNAGQLWRATHRHPAWKRDENNKVIKYSNVFPEGEEKEFFKIWEKDLEEIRTISE